MILRKVQLFAILVLAISLNGSAYAGGTWSLTGNVRTPVDGHTATLLSNGNVLIAGGETNAAVTASSEIYNASTGSWHYTGSMSVARAQGRAFMLSSGSVLIAGGCGGSCLSGTTASAEIYHPASGTWSLTGAMNRARAYFGGVTLHNGVILVAGGCTSLNANGCAAVTNSAEFYNPAIGKWQLTGSMNVARGNLSLTVLPNGMVLAAGGSTAAGDSLSSAELFNPATGKWALTGRLVVARAEHIAVLLPSGKVLVSGGENANGISSASAELYDPSIGKWALTGSMSVGRLEHTATVLMNGSVLVSGGTFQNATVQNALASAEIYNPVTRVWTKTGSLHDARTGHTATLMGSGAVLDASGAGSVDNIAASEVYVP